MDVGVEVEVASDGAKKTSNYSYGAITTYLQSGCYPPNADKQEKHGLRKRAKYFIVQGGHLHYIGGRKKKSPRLVISEEKEQLRLVQNIHDQAHLGRDKTLSQLTERYYWPEMYKQVCAYVSSIAIGKGIYVLASHLNIFKWLASI